MVDGYTTSKQSGCRVPQGRRMRRVWTGILQANSQDATARMPRHAREEEAASVDRHTTSKDSGRHVMHESRMRRLKTGKGTL